MMIPFWARVQCGHPSVNKKMKKPIFFDSNPYTHIYIYTYVVKQEGFSKLALLGALERGERDHIYGVEGLGTTGFRDWDI